MPLSTRMRMAAAGAAGGGGPQLPDLPGLILALEADNGEVYEATSDPAENGDQVDTWVDTANSVTATGVGTISKPLYQTGIVNGLPAIYGSGSWQHGAFTFSSAPTLTAFSAYLAVRADSGAFSLLRYLAGNASGTAGIGFNTSAMLEARFDSGAAPSFSDALSTNVWVIISLIYDGTDLSMFVDGVEDSASPNSIPGETFTLSATTRYNETTTRWAGHIAAYYWYDEAHDATDRQAMEAYLAEKYQ